MSKKATHIIPALGKFYILVNCEYNRSNFTRVITLLCENDNKDRYFF